MISDAKKIFYGVVTKHFCGCDLKKKIFFLGGERQEFCAYCKKKNPAVRKNMFCYYCISILFGFRKHLCQ